MIRNTEVFLIVFLYRFMIKEINLNTRNYSWPKKFIYILPTAKATIKLEVQKIIFRKYVILKQHYSLIYKWVSEFIHSITPVLFIVSMFTSLTYPSLKENETNFLLGVLQNLELIKKWKYDIFNEYFITRADAKAHLVFEI
jgi:hypothetical protein